MSAAVHKLLALVAIVLLVIGAAVALLLFPLYAAWHAARELWRADIYPVIRGRR